MPSLQTQDLKLSLCKELALQPRLLTAVPTMSQTPAQGFSHTSLRVQHDDQSPQGNWGSKSQVSLLQLFSCVQLFATPWTAAHQASLSFTISQSLLKVMSIESVMPSNHLILCHPLLLLPSIFPSIRVFSSESVLHIRWPKNWSFSFSLSPSSEYSGLISFIVDWLDLLAVQGTLKSLLQHHNSKVSVLRCLPFFMAQLSHTYVLLEKP